MAQLRPTEADVKLVVASFAAASQEMQPMPMEEDKSESVPKSAPSTSSKTKSVKSDPSTSLKTKELDAKAKKVKKDTKQAKKATKK